MASSSEASASKRQRLCSAVEMVDLSTQQDDIDSTPAATQLEHTSGEEEATPCGGSAHHMTIRERCDQIVTMSNCVNTSVEDEVDESIEDVDERYVKWICTEF